jgi:hypothetical protein
VSAYNNIDEARDSALSVLSAAADSDGLPGYAKDAVLADVNAAYDESSSWLDWGESEAGAFWTALANRAISWGVFSDARQERIDAWLVQAGKAVASSAATADEQSYITIGTGTITESAEDLADAGKATGSAFADWRPWAAAAVAGLVLSRLIGRI